MFLFSQTINWESELLPLLQRSSFTAIRKFVDVLIERDFPETHSTDVLSSDNCCTKDLLTEIKLFYIPVNEMNDFLRNENSTKLKIVSDIINNIRMHDAVNVEATCEWIIDAINKSTSLSVCNNEQLNLSELKISQTGGEDDADVDMVDVQNRIQPLQCK